MTAIDSRLGMARARAVVVTGPLGSAVHDALRIRPARTLPPAQSRGWKNRTPVMGEGLGSGLRWLDRLEV